MSDDEIIFPVRYNKTKVDILYRTIEYPEHHRPKRFPYILSIKSVKKSPAKKLECLLKEIRDSKKEIDRYSTYGIRKYFREGEKTITENFNPITLSCERHLEKLIEQAKAICVSLTSNQPGGTQVESTNK